MSLRFLSDQCVPGSVVRALQGHRHEVIVLRQVLHVRSPDEIVIAKA
jgi:hypothetical protein